MASGWSPWPRSPAGHAVPVVLGLLAQPHGDRPFAEQRVVWGELTIPRPWPGPPGDPGRDVLQGLALEPAVISSPCSAKSRPGSGPRPLHAASSSTKGTAGAGEAAPHVVLPAPATRAARPRRATRGVAEGARSQTAGSCRSARASAASLITECCLPRTRPGRERAERPDRPPAPSGSDPARYAGARAPSQPASSRSSLIPPSAYTAAPAEIFKPYTLDTAERGIPRG